MSVCANRPNETPGFFTPCTQALGGPCQCGRDVAAEQQKSNDQTNTTEETR